MSRSGNASSRGCWKTYLFQVKGASSGFRSVPDAITLTVRGPEAIVNAIETDPAFAVTVDLFGLSPGTHSLKASHQSSVRTALVRVSPERFSVTISK
jgi:YbbR domain-containing protein